MNGWSDEFCIKCQDDNGCVKKDNIEVKQEAKPCYKDTGNEPNIITTLPYWSTAPFWKTFADFSIKWEKETDCSLTASTEIMINNC